MAYSSSTKRELLHVCSRKLHFFRRLAIKVILGGFAAKPYFFGGFSACIKLFGSAAYGGGLGL